MTGDIDVEGQSRGFDRYIAARAAWFVVDAAFTVLWHPNGCRDLDGVVVSEPCLMWGVTLRAAGVPAGR